MEYRFPPGRRKGNGRHMENHGPAISVLGQVLVIIPDIGNYAEQNLKKMTKFTK